MAGVSRARRNFLGRLSRLKASEAVPRLTSFSSVVPIAIRKTSIGPTIDALRKTLDSWLGRGSYQAKEHSPKMIYKVQSNAGSLLRLKVEINTREHAPYFGYPEYRVETVSIHPTQISE
jgi:hypothetical protein